MTPTVAPRPAAIPSVHPGGIDVGGFHAAHFMGAVFPLTAGVLLYGWRAAVAFLGVVVSAAAAIALWRRVGPRGRMLRYPQGLWYAVLLAMMLPAHLAAAPAGGEAPWPILCLAGLVLVILLWLFAGMGGGHVHPVIAAYLLLVICFAQALVPHRVLNRNHLLTGELFHSGPTDARDLHNEPWISRRHSPTDSDYQESTAERLTRYTSGREEIKSRKWLDLHGLLRDAMPPLEDFIVAGQPAAIGQSSVIAIIIGGLFLLYRGMIDYRIPLLTCASAYLALLVLPIPAVINNGAQWRWAAFRTTATGWSAGITFVNYEMMASPLIFTAFFLATTASIRPMTRRGRTVFALTLGVASAAVQLYVSVSYGPYLALLIISLLTPELDKWFRVKPLI
jgi:Na+-translocating ferredoxin:NAD+ oxidoreductase RnfD subunit